MRVVICELCGARSPPDAPACASCGATELRSEQEVDLTPTPALMASRPARNESEHRPPGWLLAVVVGLALVCARVAYVVWIRVR